MAGDEDDAVCLLWVGASQHCVNIGDFCRFRNAVGGLLGEGIGLYFEAAAAFFGVTLELGLDPFARCADASAGFGGISVLRRNGGAVAEAHEFFDRLPDVIGGSFAYGFRNAAVGVTVGCQSWRLFGHFL